jgi:signal transduction histidine kinase
LTQQILSYFQTGIALVFIFAILVMFHELGHFLAARMCKMRVEEFAFGFGPKILTLFKRGETDFQRLDANALVSDVLAILHGDLVMRGIQVETQLDADLLPIEGDRVELQQVLLNLVLNACEAMGALDEGRRLLAIRTRTGDPSGVQISIRDSGCGFAPEEYERLFEAFYTTKPQGLGLGLSICRAIARAHGGRLWGTSVPGHGASFHVLLSAPRGGMGP